MQCEQKGEMEVQLLFSQSCVIWHHLIDSRVTITPEQEYESPKLPSGSLTPLQILEGTLDHLDPNGTFQFCFSPLV